MRTWLTVSVGTVCLTSAGASAQPVTPSAPMIRVVGHGSVKTPPNVATISLTVRGDGKTSDEAARALVARQKAVEAVLGGKAEVHTGKLSISEARDKVCDGGDDDVDTMSARVTRLSTGDCAVLGYVATLTITAKLTPVGEAGTMLGLVARAGAVNPRLEEFDLKDVAPAQRAAAAAAIADARAQAETIAAASRARLGALRRVEDQRARRENTGVGIAMFDVAAAQAATVPITIAVDPEPIETTADLIVEFDIGPMP